MCGGERHPRIPGWVDDTLPAAAQHEVGWEAKCEPVLEMIGKFDKCRGMMVHSITQG